VYTVLDGSPAGFGWTYGAEVKDPATEPSSRPAGRGGHRSRVMRIGPPWSAMVPKYALPSNRWSS